MEFFEVIERRKSVRKFKKINVEEEKIERICKAVMLAPSAGNLQAFKAYIVRDRMLKKEIAKICFGQKFIEEAPLCFVFFAKPEITAIYYGSRAKLYALQDATIACCFAMLAASALELASCWIGAFDDEKLKELFNESGIPIAVLPMGYAAHEPRRPTRKPFSELFEFL